MYSKRYSLWGKVIVGVIPAAVLGFLFDDLLDEHLYNFVVVAIALVVYGVAFIVVEKIKKFFGPFLLPDSHRHITDYLVRVKMHFNCPKIV